MNIAKHWPLQDCWYDQSLNLGSRYAGKSVATDLQAQVVIVGAGFAGLATAIGLVERGYQDVVVLEAETVGYGASGRNGGFVMAGYSLPEHKLMQQLGQNRARELYQLTRSAQGKIKQRIGQYKIDCDLVEQGIVLADWFNKERALKQHLDFMNKKMQAGWEYMSASTLRQWVDSPRYGAGLLEVDGAHFHPLKYLHGLARRLTAQGVGIYEHSPVTAIHQCPDGWALALSNGQNVRCSQVVVCAGGYIEGLKVPAMPMAKGVLPVATYVMTTEPIGTALDGCVPGNAAVYDTRFAFDYYRKLVLDGTNSGRLLWGGRIAIAQPSADRIAEWLKQDLLRVFPTLSAVKVDAAWGGLMGYTRPQMPSIQQSQPGLWHALGFGGHGVCSTTVAGEIIAAAIAKGENQQQLFAPFKLPSVYGWLGLVGAQSYYWWRQFKDFLQM